MDEIIKYFENEVISCKRNIDEIQNSIERNNTTSGQTHKAIEELTDGGNNAYNIFNASGSDYEFNNVEVQRLREKISQCNKENEYLEKQKKIAEEKLESVTQMLKNAKRNSGILKEYEASQCTVEEKEEPTTEEYNYKELLENLEFIHTKLDLAGKISKSDFERCKIEMNFANLRVVLLMDELKEFMDKNVSRET